MKLDHAMIRSITSGCRDISDSDGALCFHRIPDPMADLYRETDPERIRMECATGIRFYFQSDTRTLTLGLRFGEVPHPEKRCYKNVLRVDGTPILFGPDSPKGPLTWTHEIFHAGHTALRTFDIWLRHLARVDLISLEIEDGCRLNAASPFQATWLAYGDSFTQGMHASIPTRCHTSRISRQLNLECINLGVGGGRQDPRLAETVPDVDYDIVSMAYGINDFNHAVPPEIFAERATALTRALLSTHPGNPVLLITPIPWSAHVHSPTLGMSLETYTQHFLAHYEASHPRVHTINGALLLPYDRTFFDETGHPNDRGFEVYADHLAGHMKRILNLEGPV